MVLHTPSGNVLVCPAEVAKIPFSIIQVITNLGPRLDSALKLDQEINSIVRSCFFQLRWTSKLELILSKRHLESVVHTSITSTLTILIPSSTSTKGGSDVSYWRYHTTPTVFWVIYTDYQLNSGINLWSFRL